MSEWKKVKLGDITESCLGKMLDAAKNRGEYKPYLANLNVRWGSFDTNNLSLMKFEEDEDERYGIKYGDLIICEGGEPGRCAIWKEQIPDMKIQKALHRVRPKTGLVDNFYLFYWFLLAGKCNWIDQYCTGATIKHLPGQKLKEVVVDLPPLPTQHRIATILSRYDSLIENYQKQIKLLEEAAERLYKEWFVDLHFPGHENTKIVDGVPEGWEKRPVDSIYSIKYGKNLSTKLITESGEFPVYGANGVIGYYDKANCNEQVVLITSRGNGSGDVLMTYHKDAFITNNSFIVLPLEDYSYCQLPFTYQFLKNANFRAVRTGAAQPQLTSQSIHTVDVVLPSKNIIIDYCDKVSYINNKIITLRNQIRLLTEARDRLLPKLMSGEIELDEERPERPTTS